MNIKNRILRLENKPASSIRPSPLNWRTHPKEQADALRGVLAEIGFAGAILVRELEDGAYEAIDGHLRLDTAGNEPVPILVTDLTEEEAKVLLAAFDPIGDMAKADEAKLQSLLSSISVVDPSLQKMLDDLMPAEEAKTEAISIDTSKPPALSWVLIGIPTVRWDEINQDIERIAQIDGIIMETTVNNGPQIRED